VFSTFLFSFSLNLLLFGHAHESSAVFFADTSNIKVLIFLSKDCPCSKSHVAHLNKLSQEFKNIPFFGVIADRESSETEIFAYFNSKNFNFPIISDPQQSLIKQFKALKTPHAVLLKKQPNHQETILYEGGVSDQRDGASAKTYYLKENLKALTTNQPLPYAQGKSLGCYIRRI
jgi:peroxiredoxin